MVLHVYFIRKIDRIYAAEYFYDWLTVQGYIDRKSLRKCE